MHAFTQDIAAAEQVSLHELTVPELSSSDPTRNVAVLRRSEARAKERNSERGGRHVTLLSSPCRRTIGSRNPLLLFRPTQEIKTTNG
jgi:hypothetical protein